MKKLKFSLATGFILALIANLAYPIDFGIDIEAGLASAGYNDINIPGDTGSRLSLSNAKSLVCFCLFQEEYPRERDMLLDVPSPL